MELDFDLDTVAHNPFDGSLKNSFSAHPHFDQQQAKRMPFVENRLIRMLFGTPYSTKTAR